MELATLQYHDFDARLIGVFEPTSDELHLVRLGIERGDSPPEAVVGVFDFVGGKFVALVGRRDGGNDAYVEGHGFVTANAANVKSVGRGPFRRIQIGKVELRAPFRAGYAIRQMFPFAVPDWDYAEDEHFFPALLVFHARSYDKDPVATMAGHREHRDYFNHELLPHLQAGRYDRVLDPDPANRLILRTLTAKNKHLARIVGGRSDVFFP